MLIHVNTGSGFRNLKVRAHQINHHFCTQNMAIDMKKYHKKRQMIKTSPKFMILVEIHIFWLSFEIPIFLVENSKMIAKSQPTVEHSTSWIT